MGDVKIRVSCLCKARSTAPKGVKRLEDWLEGKKREEMEGFEDWEREDVGEAAKSKRRKVERRTSLLPGELHGGQHQLLHIYRAVILRGLTKTRSARGFS